MAFSPKNPNTTDWTKPAHDAAAVSASASAIAGGPTRGIYLGTAGDVTVTFLDGSSVTFANMVAGIVHPLAVTHVTALDNGAADCIALF